jgi:hypothetical protein
MHTLASIYYIIYYIGRIHIGWMHAFASAHKSGLHAPGIPVRRTPFFRQCPVLYAHLWPVRQKEKGGERREVGRERERGLKRKRKGRGREWGREEIPSRYQVVTHATQKCLVVGQGSINIYSRLRLVWMYAYAYICMSIYVQGKR